jgi:hypothetical protein
MADSNELYISKQLAPLLSSQLAPNTKK